MDSLSAHLFWDCDPATIDPESHAPFLIARVLGRGSLDDWRVLKELYGVDRLRREVTRLPPLDRRTLGFCCTYFDLPKSAFRCFTKNESSSPAPDGDGGLLADLGAPEADDDVAALDALHVSLGVVGDDAEVDAEAAAMAEDRRAFGCAGKSCQEPLADSNEIVDALRGP